MINSNWFAMSELTTHPQSVGLMIQKECERVLTELPEINKEVLDYSWLDRLLYCLAKTINAERNETLEGQDVLESLWCGLSKSQRAVMTSEMHYERVLGVLLGLTHEVLKSGPMLKRVEHDYEFSSHANIGRVCWKWVDFWLDMGVGNGAFIKALCGYSAKQDEFGAGVIEGRRWIRSLPREEEDKRNAYAFRFLEWMNCSRQESEKLLQLNPDSANTLSSTANVWNCHVTTLWFKVKWPDLFQKAFEKRLAIWLYRKPEHGVDDSLEGGMMRHFIRNADRENWNAIRQKMNTSVFVDEFVPSSRRDDLERQLLKHEFDTGSCQKVRRTL
jgi:hypothetical protein